MDEFEVDGMRLKCSLTHVTKELRSKHVARVYTRVSLHFTFCQDSMSIPASLKTLANAGPL